MQKPEITWYHKISSSEENPAKEVFAGNYKPGDTVRAVFVVWNNRFGQEECSQAKNCKIIIQPSKAELSYMIEAMKVKIDGEFKDISIVNRKATVNSNKNLNGYDITKSDFERNGNSMEISIEIPIASDSEESIKDFIIDLKYDI